MQTGGEEDWSLSDTHQKVSDSQINDEHVGRCPQTPTPEKMHKRTVKNCQRKKKLINGRGVLCCVIYIQ